MNQRKGAVTKSVSMKSGLEDRNNDALGVAVRAGVDPVSMKSGLEDRNNPVAYLQRSLESWSSQ